MQYSYVLCTQGVSHVCIAIDFQASEYWSNEFTMAESERAKYKTLIHTHTLLEEKRTHVYIVKYAHLQKRHTITSGNSRTHALSLAHLTDTSS